jgi:hypothetical protein
MKNASGTWRTIDPDLVTQADGTVAAKSHPLGLTLAGATSAADAAKIEAAGTPPGDPATPAVPLVTLDGADGKPLTVSWRGVLAAPSVAEERAGGHAAIRPAGGGFDGATGGWSCVTCLTSQKAQGYLK